MLEQPDELAPDRVLRLVCCRRCELVFLDPRLPLATMVELEAANPIYEPEADELRARLEQRRGMILELERFAPRRGRLLDIGCSRGLLLRAADELGWEAVGVELEPAAAETARVEAATTVYERIEDAVSNEPPFDLIVAWHVLEHTYDPLGFLRHARTALAPDGVLAVQTPSFSFLDEWRRRDRVGEILCAVHTLYFTRTSFENLLLSAGLRPVALEDSAEDLLLTAMCRRRRLADRARGRLPRRLLPRPRTPS